MRTGKDEKKPTKGGYLLGRCPDSHAEIAEKLGVDKSLVTRWRSGARKPTASQRRDLRELYGIPEEAWDEPWSESEKPSAPPAPPRLPADEEDDEDDDDASYAEESNTDRLRRYIREGMRELQNDSQLSGVKRAEALKKLVDAQVALDKSTGENALTMQRIVAHPEFRRVVRLITEAIAPHPEALSAVIKVLEEART